MAPPPKTVPSTVWPREVAAFDWAVIGPREVDSVEMLVALLAIPVDVEVDREAMPVEFDVMPLKADDNPLEVDVDREAIPVEFDAIPL